MKKILDSIKSLFEGLIFAIELFSLVGIGIITTIFCVTLVALVIALICLAIFSPFILIACII